METNLAAVHYGAAHLDSPPDRDHLVLHSDSNNEVVVWTDRDIYALCEGLLIYYGKFLANPHVSKTNWEYVAAWWFAPMEHCPQPLSFQCCALLCGADPELLQDEVRRILKKNGTWDAVKNGVERVRSKVRTSHDNLQIVMMILTQYDLFAGEVQITIKPRKQSPRKPKVHFVPEGQGCLSLGGFDDEPI